MGNGAQVDPREKFGDQRHAFILAYYNMAVQDLSRHLGVGWQTLTSVVGTIALLSLAQESKLPLPIAVAAALAIGFWGALNILDADYWATRAIAFLANVEAIYFYRDERKYFNSYAGLHPPLKVMDSLRYQLYAVALLVFIVGVFYLEKVVTKAGSIRHLADAIWVGPSWKVLYWLLPAYVFLLMIWVVVHARRERIENYLSFVTESPGPGMVKNKAIYRGMDLGQQLTSADLETGEELQFKLRTDLAESAERWKKIDILVGILCPGVALFSAAMILFR